jgi:hypothetical protein
MHPENWKSPDFLSDTVFVSGGHPALPCAAEHETTVDDCENDGLVNGAVSVIKRAVEEDLTSVGLGGLHARLRLFEESVRPAFLTVTALRFEPPRAESDRSAFTALMAARIWSKVTLLFP